MPTNARPILLAAILIVPFTAWNQSQPSSAQPSSANTTQGGAAPPSSTPAQQTPESVYQTATVLKAVTRLVIVDVVASDKKGEPVKDLKLSDFAIQEDGREQALKVFNFQQPASDANSAAPVPVVTKLPENIFSNFPTYKSSSALNVVLLDALNTTAPNQAYVREQMIHYLEKMPAGRPVAVYTLGTRLRLVQDFTTNPATLKEVVSKLKTSISPLLDNPTGGPEPEVLPAGMLDSGTTSAAMADAIMSFQSEATAAQTDIRVSYTLTAMNQLARRLAGYPGRKNLVWVSESLPMNIDPNIELSNVFIGTRDYGPEIAATAQAMMDSQVAVYPVDARGLVASSYFSAASNGRDKFGRSLSAPGRLGAALSNESAALQQAQASMRDIAERTGGKAFYNRNDIDTAIRNSIEDGSTYYTLGYYPENKQWNGRFRKIHVTVNRPGIKLHYRLGYYAVDPKAFTGRNEKQQNAVFSDELSLDSPLSTALPFHAGVIQPSPATENKVQVNFGLDAHALSFEQDAAGLHHARVECAIAAFTSRGKYVNSAISTVNAALKPDTFNRVMQGYFPCQQKIELPAGSYVLRLGVRDLSTGLIGTANGKVLVPAAEGTSN